MEVVESPDILSGRVGVGKTRNTALGNHTSTGRHLHTYTPFLRLQVPACPGVCGTLVDGRLPTGGWGRGQPPGYALILRLHIALKMRQLVMVSAFSLAQTFMMHFKKHSVAIVSAMISQHCHLRKPSYNHLCLYRLSLATGLSAIRRTAVWWN